MIFYFHIVLQPKIFSTQKVEPIYTKSRIQNFPLPPYDTAEMKKQRAPAPPTMLIQQQHQQQRTSYLTMSNDPNSHLFTADSSFC